jgi:hypothetical protein
VWEILYTDQFGQWWGDLTEDQQEALRARVELLEERGLTLVGRSSTPSSVPVTRT